jgi:transposase, IS30 family
VSLSCGSLWFIDAGRVSFVETPISPRYLSQDDRIEIADGRARGEPVKQIAARIGKSYQSVYRELARNRKSDGRYQPWFAHNQAYLRRRRVKSRRFAVQAGLREAVAGRLAKHWSPAQISRWLRRRFPRRSGWHVCTETIYEAVYRGLIVPIDRQNLRTGRIYRRRRGRGRTRNGALKQSTCMKSIHDRPAAAKSRRQVGQSAPSQQGNASRRLLCGVAANARVRVAGCHRLVRSPDLGYVPENPCPYGTSTPRRRSQPTRIQRSNSSRSTCRRA